ncbi:KedN5 family methylcobalamin-dependent radical SAM C-methyltransferase [Actinomadura parmotrematis]|uniref:KedN5 family methylcobalamin-dependent radical SAM C-methyltransferase n=1 Tax=Actinomadura parmotrematis TaxID=2864039 RepID=A0ABS7FXI5_9ACTN|nr:KedN5 family methylcobalamin-dependent radical SAM C-methyltransferase [Actinomadura parmotrematis]MBW8484302.1 KedN5 family methylcobalamin-dependent radical SAM C-methyltransferase [Actinomadura parmotrematis]
MFEIRLVQQAAWDVPVDSMPLASGYLKAVLDSRDDLGTETNTEICNFRGGAKLTEMARELLGDGRAPDLVAFSVLGWNYRSFGCLAETYKQLNPRGTVVFGGVHVANQAERVFREFPCVDVVVNGEGELTFADLVGYLLERRGDLDPAHVQGLSYRRPDGTVETTPDRPRIEDLDIIPSPFLTGAIPMTNAAGGFRYDVALMETNRGCPYKCSFCYWGGAVGQRVRSFSRQRLAEELDYFGFHKAPVVCLCDANFGLLEADEEFVEDLIGTRRKYGYPRALESSWAKNKSERFRRIVTALKEHDFHSSFMLSLQTLSSDALTAMDRKNMKLNQWESLVDWLAGEGMDCVGELIWGAPGETPESFLAGYDRLSERLTRTAVYPLLLLPNTAYTDQRELHGFVTVRGDDDDFEYVLTSRGATLAESLRMQRFVFWARLLDENHYLHHVWAPARTLTGLTQSQIITGLMEHFEAAPEPAAAAFLDLIPVLAESPGVVRALRALYESPELEEIVARWWRTVMVPAFPPAWRGFAAALYEFERWSRPLYVQPGRALPAGWRQDGPDAYVSEPVPFAVDVAALLERGVTPASPPPEPEGASYVFRSPAGFYYNADNHEISRGYRGLARDVRQADFGRVPAAPPSA